MKALIKNTLRQLGFELVRPRSTSRTDDPSLLDFTQEEKRMISIAKPFTMTSVERMAALLTAVTHVSKHQIHGDIAECGVWRGGSMMLAALALKARGDLKRSLYLYDTYEGMPPPTSQDTSFDGICATEQLHRDARGTGVWCYASLQNVRANVLSTGYPEEKLHLVKGKVEETIPHTLPTRLSILRLDTDWYESTRHELRHLYPLLCVGGILIIDDYGHWQGARKAVDEYFEEIGAKDYLHRIDYTGRLLVKTGN